METASAVYVQIKHQLLWASVPLLTCGWNIRCGKGQSRDYKWNRFRLFHQKSRMSHDAGDIPLDASKDTPRPARDFLRVKSPGFPWKRPNRAAVSQGPFPMVTKVIKSNYQTMRNYLISFSDCRPKALSNNQPRCFFHLPTLSECSPLIRSE